MDPNVLEPNQKFEEAINHFKIEISGIRAGRANPSLIENIMIDAYGGKMKLLEVGNISAPQPSLLTVQVWDQSIAENVRKAIMDASLGLNPANDGTLIRIPIPPLTQERREEYIKLLHAKMEDGKVALRQIRQDTRNTWKQALDAGEFGEDELSRREKLLQEMIDKRMVEIDELGRKKQEELLQM